MLEVGDRVLELQLNVFAVEPMVPRRGGEEIDGEERHGEVECGKRRTAARGFWRWRDDKMSTAIDPAGRNERKWLGGINIVADAFNHALDHESYQRVIPNRARLSHEQSLARKR